jgi:hypothetical protein
VKQAPVWNHRPSRHRPSRHRPSRLKSLGWALAYLGMFAAGQQFAGLGAAEAPIADVERQPLAANIRRTLEAYQYLGHPHLAQTLGAKIATTADSRGLQRLLDPYVCFVVEINAESRVKVQLGPRPALAQQGGYTPLLVKVLNASTVTKRLRIHSPQSGAPYAGVAELSMKRQQQESLRANEKVAGGDGRFLHVEMFDGPPMRETLSGLEVEYRLALLYSSEAGKREALIQFDVAQGTQDLGFRGEVPLLLDVRPAFQIPLEIRDDDGKPTTARLEIRDARGIVYPPQARRLAPDFFFQPQIYRHDGETVLLPRGKFELAYGRGPEYLVQTMALEIGDNDAPPPIQIQLKRWVTPRDYGFFSGDHHIHAAGCAHYQSPTEGVGPPDMYRQVKGEGLNVGCVLTWGPCFDFQRQFFAASASELSEPFTLLKYDLEISGFGSQALGHVCLLNLEEQTFPGSDGTSTKGWPTWTTPVMRWAKEQGGYTGYAHSSSGLQIDPKNATRRLFTQADNDNDGSLSPREAETVLLPFDFRTVDADADNTISQAELIQSHERSADELPNFAIPEMNGVGAMEICVSTAMGVCDFISAMDTERIQEWNTWYHLLNCGFPLKVSGETDFPCMSSRSVGTGRVYVQVDVQDQLHFKTWCQRLAEGRSYVSDGYAHALKFQVDQQRPGDAPIKLAKAGKVTVSATVSFSPATPLTVAQGLTVPSDGRRAVGDTRILHGPRVDAYAKGGRRLVELIVNGRVVQSQWVLANGEPQDLRWELPITQSSWVALRQFPQLHTNPVDVHVADAPIRASADSARWCIAMTEQLWRTRKMRISAPERDEAEQTFQQALEILATRRDEAGGTPRAQ